MYFDPVDSDDPFARLAAVRGDHGAGLVGAGRNHDFYVALATQIDAVPHLSHKAPYRWSETELPPNGGWTVAGSWIQALGSVRCPATGRCSAGQPANVVPRGHRRVMALRPVGSARG